MPPLASDKDPQVQIARSLMHFKEVETPKPSDPRD